MTFCKCSATLNNTGTPSTQRIVREGAKLFAVHIKADDGTLNVIKDTDVVDQTFLDGKINEVDPTKRWYPIGEFKSVEDVRGDPITESFSDGSSGVTTQGVRSFVGWLLDFAPKYIENLKNFSCVKFGVFISDECGLPQGSISNDGTELKPFRVNEQSWFPTFMKASKTAVSRVQLAFEFSQLESDSNIRVLDETESTANFLEAEGLLELDGAISGITTTAFNMALTVDFDRDFTPEKQIGFVITDFILFNTTTNLAIVITSVTEAPEGTYAFLFPIQTAADVLRLTTDRTTGNKPGKFLKELITLP